MRKRFLLCLALLLFAVPSIAGEYVTVPSGRPGSDLRYWTQQSDKRADTLVLILPGGSGAGWIKKVGDKYEFRSKYLNTLMPALDKAGMIVAIFDTPSDMSRLIDPYRKSIDQTTDIQTIISRFKVPRVFILSISRSGMSLASFGVNNTDKRVKGLIFTGTIQCEDYTCMSPVEKIKTPVLFVHHVNDGCPLNSLKGAEEVFSKIVSGGNKDALFHKVSAGSTVPGADPCFLDNSYHGFHGTEDETNDKIIGWITTR